MRVLVCGGRDYPDREHVHRVLTKWHGKMRISILITGMAGQKDKDERVLCGADLLAWEWAKAAGVETLEYPVKPGEWNRLGKAAGPLRNERMLREGEPDIVLAFPGNKGTSDMTRRARAASVPVISSGWE